MSITLFAIIEQSFRLTTLCFGMLIDIDYIYIFAKFQFDWISNTKVMEINVFRSCEEICFSLSLSPSLPLFRLSLLAH